MCKFCIIFTTTNSYGIWLAYVAGGSGGDGDGDGNG